MHMCVCTCALSHAQLFLTPWTVAYQTPVSMEFFKQEYGVCHVFLQWNFLTQESNPSLLCLLHRQVDSLPLCHLGSGSKHFSSIF